VPKIECYGDPMVSVQYHIKIVFGCANSQAFSCRSSNSEVPNSPQAILCGICDEQSGSATY